MKHWFSACVVPGVALMLACGGGDSPPSNGGGGGGGGGGGTVGQYRIVAASELGMHCMDGKDYSVFAVLPPYNTVHAQVIRQGNPPELVTSGVTVTYEAVADSAGSINTSSASKTNFWSWVGALFHSTAAPEQGLTGNPTQSLTPRPLTFDNELGYWKAEGIPTVPYDDAGVTNPYPTARIVARDPSGAMLASVTIVLAVSDEMRCNTCHASNSNPAARPASGWENDPDPAKDVKYNILKLHDQHVDATPYLPALRIAGYNYQASLYATAKNGMPILCATCHKSNALGTTGVTGVRSLTADMHARHGPVLIPGGSTTLDDASNPENSCYLCHPGVTTKCQRGAMRNVFCFDCHGDLTQVGSSAREGWMDVPNCQMCHTNGTRYATTFSSPGVWRSSSDTRFATRPNVPVTGKSLYRFSRGHGDLYCATCHGSPHAEFPSAQANDNLYSNALQGHNGTIAECGVCHTTMPETGNGGPHGMHTVGQSWIRDHQHYAETAGVGQCAACHGASFRGSPLARTTASRSFNVEERTRTYSAGDVVGCYDCHDGPGGD